MKKITNYSFLIFTLLSLNSHAEDLTNSGNYYFFGDSSMGQGNFSAIVGEVGEDHFPYSSNNGHARDSNGLIWVEMLGRDVDIIFDDSQTAKNKNFAISGAHMTRSGDSDLDDAGVESGVLRQTEIFGELVTNGGLPVNSDDVFFIQAGGNDLLDRLRTDDRDVIISDIAQAAASNISTLVAVGAKTIVLSEVESIDYSPQFTDLPDLKAQMAEIMVQTNDEMLKAVKALDFGDDVNIVMMKHTEFVSYVTTNANKLGFDVIDRVCYDDDAETLCSTNKAEQNRYIFFDDLHLTEAAHRIEAQWFSATLAGADGSASRQTSRLPDVFQYELEASLLPQQQLRTQRGDQPYTLFSDITYDKATLKGRGKDPAADVNLKGVLIGAEAQILPNILVGGSLRISDNRTSFADGGKIEGDTKAIYGWAGYMLNNVHFGISGAYGWLDVDRIDRVTGVDLLTAKGKTDGHFHDVGAEVSTVFETAIASFDMGISTHVSQIRINDYVETGATGLNLSYEDQTLKSRRIQFGLSAKGNEHNLSQSISITPIIETSYRYEFEDDGHNLSSKLFNNTANSVTIKTGGSVPHRFNGGVGFDVNFVNGSIGARYQKTWGKDVSDTDAFKLTANYRF